MVADYISSSPTHIEKHRTPKAWVYDTYEASWYVPSLASLLHPQGESIWLD